MKYDESIGRMRAREGTYIVRRLNDDDTLDKHTDFVGPGTWPLSFGVIEKLDGSRAIVCRTGAYRLCDTGDTIISVSRVDGTEKFFEMEFVGRI